MSLATQLTSVQAAITKIEAGAQSVTVDGVTINRADVRTLYAREQRLLRKIDAASTMSRTICEF